MRVVEVCTAPSVFKDRQLQFIGCCTSLSGKVCLPSAAMAGLFTTKTPKVVAVAAALVTAVTSEASSVDRVINSPYIVYHANSSLLPTPSSSSVLSSAAAAASSTGSTFARMSYPTSPLCGDGSYALHSAGGTCVLPEASSSSSTPSMMGSMYSCPRQLMAHSSPAARASGAGSIVRSSRSGDARGVFRQQGWSLLGRPGTLSSPSPLFASCLTPSSSFSGLELGRGENRSPFALPLRISSRATLLTSSTFSMFMHPAPAQAQGKPSWSLNSPPAPGISDLASYLAAAFVSDGARTLPSSGAEQSTVISSTFIQRRSSNKSGDSSSPSRTEDDDGGTRPRDRPVRTVVLLGWLGSQQRHLKKYAEWYIDQGYRVVTFTVPMANILSLSMIGKVDKAVDELTNELATWLESQGEKCPERQLIFHTFSNAGWLTYGIVLEKLSLRGSNWSDRIKGCVVDSAPAADPDPQIWASGFSAALLGLRKRNVGAARIVPQDASIANSTQKLVIPHTLETSRPHFEEALNAVLKKFFLFFLRIPAINRRLDEVVTVLSNDQPHCPQLYVYSTADKVIPVKLVESFMEKQKKLGRNVRGCNFQSSPHVDHFRSFPEKYSNQVGTFLKECLQEVSVSK